MSKIGIIISREYKERVRKKSFIITTLLMPLFMLALYLAPTLIMSKGSIDLQQVIVVDDSPNKIVSSQLESNDIIEFTILEDITKQEASAQYADKSSAYGVLYLGSNILEDSNDLQFFVNESASMLIEENIMGQLERIISGEKMRSYNIDGIEEIIASTDVSINNLNTVKNDGSGDEDQMKSTSSIFSYLLALFLGLILYMIIILYGQMVMTTVIEEKSSRVLDVIVTTCKPFDIMMGKILGIAAVAATQIAIWGVLIIAGSQFLIPAIASIDPSSEAGSAINSLLAQITDFGFIIKLMVAMLVYVIGGFLLYASLFAAAGSAVDNAQDGQQFSTIILLPIMFSLIIMMQVFNNPNAEILKWCSMIPFTSPIVMMARIPYGVENWELLLSFAILIVSFIATTWIAARIYRIGILTHGKKPSWKDLGQWIRG